MDTGINIKDAAFSYGENQIWSGLNLDVARGEMLCLLGPNGCGKTTLLNCIHGDLKLNRGAILIDGQPITKMGVTDIAKKIGFVFQEHSAPFPYPALEVVSMGRGPHLGLFQSPARHDIEIAENSLESMGIAHLWDKRYTEISGGERQLVLIARTLAQEPKAILLDEPTSHLDFKNQALVLDKISGLAEQGMTIIMTTHFPNHALSSSSRVALMNNGGFIAVGGADKVMTEENLRETYGISVRIFSADDPVNGSTVKFCVPSVEAADVIASGLPGIENVFDGKVRLEGDIARIDIGGGVVIEAVTRKEGDAKIFIPSEGIILSRRPLKSSGRNALKGTVTGVLEQDMRVKVEVDVGRKIVAHITRKSLQDMGLKNGVSVYLTFKATEVQVFPEKKPS